MEMKSKGQFVCSGTCHRFTAYKIYEHVIVGCDDCVFCNWWRSRKSGPNLYALILSGLPKGIAGNEGGISKCSRTGQKINRFLFMIVY